MNTLEIVLLSLLAGLAIALLIATAVYLAWMLHSAKRGLSAMQSTTATVIQDISALKTQIDVILNSHRQAIDSAVARINGDKLAEASNVIFRSAQDIKTACVAFGELSRAILSGDIVEPELARAARSGLGPESYAPNPTGERFVGQSRTASQDGDDLLDESGGDRTE